jgi:uncharacterized protein YndB with AHSA1/START domain
MRNAESFNASTPGDREIVLRRVFDAPPRLVWDALTNPELLKRWLLGPPGWTMPICEIDLRVGGAYRYVWRQDSDRAEFGTAGVFREITRAQRLVATEKFEQAWYPGEAIATYTLMEQAGKTTLTLTMLYESTEARDAALKSGMEKGVAASFDRLEEILATTEKFSAQAERGAS